MNRLHVDLPHTTLEDFAEHFERALQESTPLLLAILPPMIPIFSMHRETDAISPEETHAAKNPDPSQYAKVLINRSAMGKTQLFYLVIIQRADGVFELELAVMAIRYRHDKLRVIVTGFVPRATPRIKAIRRWLGLLWGEGEGGIVVVPPREAAKQAEYVAGPSYEPRNQADQWLIHEFFEVHQEKRRPGTFVEEWLAKRRELDTNDNTLVNPADNVRQIISKERTRRKANMNE